MKTVHLKCVDCDKLKGDVFLLWAEIKILLLNLPKLFEILCGMAGQCIISAENSFSYMSLTELRACKHDDLILCGEFL